jgi:hypothetical protein
VSKRRRQLPAGRDIDSAFGETLGAKEAATSPTTAGRALPTEEKKPASRFLWKKQPFKKKKPTLFIYKPGRGHSEVLTCQVL